MQFYLQGGLFMHFVTLSAIAAAFYTLRSRQLLRGALDTDARKELGRTMELASGYVGLGLAMGLLGTFFGVIETAAAVQSAPTEELAKATMRGLSISLTTLTFATMLAIPLGFVGMSNRARFLRA